MKKLLILIIIFGLFYACGGDDDVTNPTDGDDVTQTDDDDSGVILCESSSECPIGQKCNGGVCEEEKIGDDDDDDNDDNDDNDVTDGTPFAEPEEVTVNFGGVKVGETAEKDVVLKNTGDGVLVIDSIAMGLGGAGFTFKSEIETPVEVQPGDVLTVTMVFTPVDATDYSDSVKFTHNAEGSPTEINIVGIGTGGPSNLVVSPSGGITFDTTAAGSKSAPKKITLKNDASEESLSVTISSIEIPAPGNEQFEFSFEGALPVTIAPQEIFQIELVFAPTSEGEKSGNLVIKSDDINNSSINVSLSGIALASGATVIPSEVNFDDTVYGSESSEQLVTIKNDGSTVFNIEAIEVYPDSFEITEMPQPLPAGVAIGATRKVWVKFVPQSEGDFEGTLTFTTDLPNQTEIVVPLNGSGVALDVDEPVAKAIIMGTEDIAAKYMINVSAPIELDGSDSYDPTADGAIKGIATYNWEIIEAPATHDAKLEKSTADNRRVKFSTTTRGTYKISLEVINNGGKTSTNEAFITIDAMVQEALKIEADWVNHNRGAGVCNGEAGTSRTYVSACYNDRRDVDVILKGPGNKICREPEPREGPMQATCDWAELGSPVWSDENGALYRQPESIEFIPEPQPIQFSTAVQVSLEDDTYCPGFLTLCGDSSCTKEGVCVTVDVKVNYQSQQIFEDIVLDKKGDVAEVCGIEYDYGKWTVVIP